MKKSINQQILTEIKSIRKLLEKTNNQVVKKTSLEKENEYLTLIKETLIVDKLDGKEFIYGDRKVFKSYIDNDFKNLKLNQASEATKETAVQVHKLAEDATFAKMFTSLSGDLDKLCLTQHQIKRFCVKYPGQLSQGCATFFLFKLNGEYFVAHVNVRGDGLDVFVYRFEFDRLWDAGCGHRLVVPSQL